MYAIDVMGAELGTKELIAAGGALGLCVFAVVVLAWARRWEGRVLSGQGRLDEGRVIGVVGLMGSGKTSFIVKNWLVPALTKGWRVISNFGVVADGLAGHTIMLRPNTFGRDLLGIGSSLNLDDETGQPMSGWFVDTACTCGKGHDKGCDRVMPIGGVCCKGFAAQRSCGCQAAVVVIDESHAFLPANQSRPLPIEVLTWLTMARKNHLLIIWSTQYYKWVHSACRRLTQDVFRCRPGDLDGKHIAELCRLGNNGDLGNEVISTIKFDNKSVRDRYDTYEVIIPAHTAHELAGSLSRERLLGDAVARPATPVRPILRPVPTIPVQRPAVGQN